MAVIAAFFLLALVFAQTSAHPLTFYKNSPDEPTVVLNIVCPGSAKECPDGNTCCAQGDGNFGCCPKVHAVCCKDKKHCCPSGYTCDKDNAQCMKADFLHPLIELSTSNIHPEAVDVLCPDNKESCTTGKTCCPLEGGVYGCCPKPDAVCCSDLKHCCPEGYMCADGQCEQGLLTHPLVELAGYPEKQEANADVTCPDDKQECPSGDTCCPTGGGSYGCCPKPDAVCCSDEKHCCPSGYKCETGSGMCEEGAAFHPLVELASKQVKIIGEPSIICPDNEHECPSGDTCCPTGGGSYGCCPKVDAVCCSDDKHCCPNGYKCETGSGLCQKGLAYHPLVELAGHLEKAPIPQYDILCPDGVQQCTKGSTCCQIDNGGYGCCPGENSVCCPHGISCCPHGFTCNGDMCDSSEEGVLKQLKITW